MQYYCYCCYFTVIIVSVQRSASSVIQSTHKHNTSKSNVAYVTVVYGNEFSHGNRTHSHFHGMSPLICIRYKNDHKTSHSVDPVEKNSYFIRVTIRPKVTYLQVYMYIHVMILASFILYFTGIDFTYVYMVTVIACSHGRHGQDKTVLFCPVSTV